MSPIIAYFLAVFSSGLVFLSVSVGVRERIAKWPSFQLTPIKINPSESDDTFQFMASPRIQKNFVLYTSQSSTAKDVINNIGKNTDIDGKVMPSKESIENPKYSEILIKNNAISSSSASAKTTVKMDGCQMACILFKRFYPITKAKDNRERAPRSISTEDDDGMMIEDSESENVDVDTSANNDDELLYSGDSSQPNNPREFIPKVHQIFKNYTAAVTFNSKDSGTPLPTDLRLVALTHYKSLVIAELKWDAIGGNPKQDYLITWELVGGGLKGHLVTDSTSVTLSLWPDTIYQIQVEKFQQNFDGHYKQPTTYASTPFHKSPLPLTVTVDTREASFPVELPSALLSSHRDDIDDDDDYSENEYKDENVSVRKVYVALEVKNTLADPSAHKSFTGGFLNMTLLIGIAISALLFVIVILTVAAFTWTRMRALSASPHSHRHHRANFSPSSFELYRESPIASCTENAGTPTEFKNCDIYHGGGCHHDCDVDICGDGRSIGYSSQQPFLYCHEDYYAWDKCHQHKHRHFMPSSPLSVYYPVGSSNHFCDESCGCNDRKDDDVLSIPQCLFDTKLPKGNKSSDGSIINGYSNDVRIPFMPAAYKSSLPHTTAWSNSASSSVLRNSISFMISNEDRFRSLHHNETVRPF